MRRRELTCSIGWWVGPSSPTKKESWVKTVQDRQMLQCGHADGVSLVVEKTRKVYFERHDAAV